MMSGKYKEKVYDLVWNQIRAGVHRFSNTEKGSSNRNLSRHSRLVQQLLFSGICKPYRHDCDVIIFLSEYSAYSSEKYSF